jgi:hypothetical protein
MPIKMCLNAEQHIKHNIKGNNIFIDSRSKFIFFLEHLRLSSDFWPYRY